MVKEMSEVVCHMKVIEVVGGIIRREGKFLLGKRPFGKAQGGHWEFIGRKIEPGETPDEMKSLDFCPADAELLPMLF